ncbi:Copia protein [Eumeta japonica]|uniref:Copia protein n=1 Tax=Eumeta variegata TaxID=151549 RepID=A0A4C1T423_EUMVA|nr:Copia protein [Eumeta japonica]
MGDNREMHGIPQFRGDGFDDWQFRVRTHLDSLNLLDVLTDSPPTEANSLADFNKRDKKAKERIVTFVHSDCLSFIREKETAKDMWSSLKDAFAKQSVVNQLLLRKKLAKLKMNEGDSIVAHFMKFENLVRQLKLAGAKMENCDVLTQLFLTLPEKYDPLVTALQNVDDGKLDLNLVKERLMSEEAKLSDRNNETTEERMAFSSKKFKNKQKFKGRCFKCNKFGYQSKNCFGKEKLKLQIQNEYALW